LWGVGEGLPYVFNADEGDHFVPKAVEMFQHGSLNPHYFANPPAFTYLLHYLFAVWYGGGSGALSALRLHPGDLYTLARVAAAVLGTLALWLLYTVGARLFSRGVGLLAAAIEAVAFLPVFYSHLALNDVPTLAPLTLSLLGSAGVLRKGRVRDYLLAGVGLGLACATKYTAGIVLLPLGAAIALAYLERGRAGPGPTLAGIAVAGAGALGAFLIANPYALLDYHSFHGELVHQSTLSAEGQGKLGAPKQGGLVYYLWSLTWGLGWVPALAALGGAPRIWRSPPRLGSLLARPERPRAHAAAGAGGITARARRLRGVQLGLTTLIVLALLAQGLIYSVHSGLVLSRSDTRNGTRRWMLAHIPRASPIVVEPVSPNEWANETQAGTSTATNPQQWIKYPSLLPRISASGALQAPGRQVTIEDYVRTLAPALLGYYERHGYCWVISGSTQSDRAFADPRAVPLALAYYRALAQQGEVVYRASPYAHRPGPVAFNFDWSFDYSPLAYRRPGPAMTVYRLRGGRCAGG